MCRISDQVGVEPVLKEGDEEVNNQKIGIPIKIFLAAAHDVIFNLY